MEDINKAIEEYTPCRISECYLDQDDVVEVRNITGTFRLKGFGRSVWVMLDGAHTIRSIVDMLHPKMPSASWEAIKAEVVNLIGTLSKKKSIIINWDPLYKLQKSQELN